MASDVEGFQFLLDGELAEIADAIGHDPWLRVLRPGDGPDLLVRLGTTDDGRLVCTGILLNPREPREVTSRLLRAIPLAELVRMAADFRDGKLPEGAPDGSLGDALNRAVARTLGDEFGAMLAQGRPRAPGGGAWNDDHYREVAARFREGEGLGVPPARHVATVWPTSEPTARRWIAEARRRGLLEPWAPKSRLIDHSETGEDADPSA